MNIRKGQQIWIRPEWQDEGDDALTWYAVEDSHDDRASLKIQNLEATKKFRFAPVHTVDVAMITTTNPNT
jgi:hypothetical protein